MGFTYEVAVKGILLGVQIANIYHLWDGDENATLSDIADVFEDNLLTDMLAQLTDHLTFTEIVVSPMDYINPANPYARPISLTGLDDTDPAPPGNHVWAKFQSDDAGEKAGGKMIAGILESALTDGLLTAGHLAAWQVIFDAYLVDLTTAGLAAAIYRPTESIPGEPEISICTEILVRGASTNNRRWMGFTA